MGGVGAGGAQVWVWVLALLGDVDWTWMLMRMGRIGSTSPPNASKGMRNRNVRRPSTVTVTASHSASGNNQPSFVLRFPLLSSWKVRRGYMWADWMWTVADVGCHLSDGAHSMFRYRAALSCTACQEDAGSLGVSGVLTMPGCNDCHALSVRHVEARDWGAGWDW